jgi:Na+/melibiose symporter-like transporter
VAPNPPLTWREQWDALVTNANLRHVLTPDLLIGIAQGVSGSLFLFYFQHVLGFETQSQTLLAIYFISGVAGVPVWIWLGHRIGKHRALQAACLYAAAVTFMILLIPSGAFWIAAPMMALAGVHQAANVLLLRAMMADVVDEDFLKCGAQRSGLFFGLILTTSKLGIAVGPVALAVLSAFGYDPDLGARNTPQATQALTWLFIGLTASIYLLSAWSLRFYKLDEARQRALRAEIDARSQRAQSQ